MYPYFQIGQHSKNIRILKLIKEFLANLPNSFNYTKNSPVPQCSEVINKNTSVYSFSISNTDSLYDYILFFFLKLPFQTRKFLDFQLWGISLHLRKYGYIYSSKGRKLILNISQNTNKYRYTTNTHIKVKPITDEEILEVLSEKLPVDLTPEMTNTLLSKAFRNLKPKSDYRV
jgi:hypothetical protein